MEPETTNNPTENPKENNPPPQENPAIDLDSILLKRKETPIDALSRASADKVMAEQAIPFRPYVPEKPLPPPPAPPARAPGDEDLVKSLETYQGDIQDVVQKKQVSVASIAAAESARREPVPEPKSGWSIGKTILFTLGGLLLLAAAGGIVYFILSPHPVAVPQAPTTPFITVDETQAVPLSASSSPEQALSTLSQARMQASIPLGLVEALVPVSPNAQGQEAEMSAQNFLTLIAPDIPQDLLRTVESPFLLGIHSSVDNQPFLLLHVDAYQQGFSGMLAWEPTLLPDLSPLFANTQATAAQLTGALASTSAASSTQLINTPFVDGILENHDVRELKDAQGDILLLWTFLDPNTLLITTNDATLKEVISRLSQVSVTTAAQ